MASKTSPEFDEYVRSGKFMRQWMHNLRDYYDKNPEAKAGLERLRAYREAVGPERFEKFMRGAFRTWLTGGR